LNSNRPMKISGGENSFRLRHIFLFILLLLAILALQSYHAEDLAVLLGGKTGAPANWIGRLGAWFSAALFLLLGLASYLIMALAVVKAIRIFFGRGGRFSLLTGGVLLMVFGAVVLLGLAPEQFTRPVVALGLGSAQHPEAGLSGGVLGQWLAGPACGTDPEGWLRQLLGYVGVSVLGWGFFTAGAILCYLADWHRILCGILTNQMSPAGRERMERAIRNGVRDEDDAFEIEGEEEEEEPEEEPADTGKTAEKGSLLKRLLGKKSAPERGSAIDRFLGQNAGAEDPGEELPLETAPAGKGTSAIDRFLEENADKDPEAAPGPASEPAPAPEPILIPDEPEEQEEQEEPQKTVSAPAADSSAPSTRITEKGSHASAVKNSYTVPPISMLSKGPDSHGEAAEIIAAAKENLQRTLEDFGIEGHVVSYSSGPRVTRFSIALAPGVNVKKVESISDTIKMNLAADSIRVLAPIPGQPYVGVEVSNRNPGAVFMRSVMESEAWSSGKAEIPIALGEDVAGKPVVLDIAKAPHMLIAGSTGTGKSVCSNSLIMSLLFRFRPDELKLIMVDPKVVEFDVYKNLPHLITPVINDSNKAPLALRWAVNEMEKRYRIFAKSGVKKIAEFNALPEDREELYDDDGIPIPNRMPILLTIIDELGDLMLTEAKKDIENYITRIAQKGRAAGVHIVVATQRPDVKVITGNIKANLPTRLCFQVRTLMDSRVILDASGGEKLLGKGDMLYMSPTSMNIERVQGSFIPDPDIKKVVNYICEQMPPEFNSSVMAEPVGDDGGEDEDGTEILPIDPEDRADIAPLVKKYLRPGDPEVLRKALEVVILDRKASTSYFQRRLGIGYNKAAELTDLLEERGVVGPASGSGNKREILIWDGLDVND